MTVAYFGRMSASLGPVNMLARLLAKHRFSRRKGLTAMLTCEARGSGTSVTFATLLAPLKVEIIFLGVLALG